MSMRRRRGGGGRRRRKRKGGENGGVTCGYLIVKATREEVGEVASGIEALIIGNIVEEEHLSAYEEEEKR